MNVNSNVSKIYCSCGQSWIDIGVLEGEITKASCSHCGMFYPTKPTLPVKGDSSKTLNVNKTTLSVDKGSEDVNKSFYVFIVIVTVLLTYYSWVAVFRWASMQQARDSQIYSR